MKTRLTEIAKDLGIPFRDALAMAKEKLSGNMISGRGGATWITEDGVSILEAATIVPEAIPKYVEVFVIKKAPNPKYVFGLVEETQEKVSMFVPRKFRGRDLRKKWVLAEKIEDVNGSSYRYIKSRFG
jgi:hypothetical protein